MKDIFPAIPIFVAVVEAGSFSLAAERLGMTKSAVSKRISSLEDNLGTRLFHRSTRKLTLTESGEEFSDYARNSVYIAQQGITAATLNQGNPKGTLKINAPMTFSRLHLAPHLKEFLDLYPDIKVILSMDDQV
ncbi:LysR family transcriptional regulator, partial [Vibrio anguillarum]|nr:LysR family transcriptional regulator [Vibrio anguillarum]